MKSKKLFNFSKSAVLIFVFFTFFLSSCKKSDHGGSNSTNTTSVYLKCKINGVLHNFNYQVNANDRPDGNIVHFVVIGGNENAGSGGPSFAIQLTSATGASENVIYKGYPNSPDELYFDYYYQTSNGTVNYEGGRGGSEGSSAILTITSLTNWGVKGTFSGVLINYQTGEIYNITEGEFAAPYN